jgi:low affinity Fe/Cu permease
MSFLELIWFVLTSTLAAMAIAVVAAAVIITCLAWGRMRQAKRTWTIVDN